MTSDKAHLQFLTLCDLASITREGKLNILGIFQQIFVREFPTRYLKFTIVGILQGIPQESIPITLKIFTPDQQLAMPEQTVMLHFGNGGHSQMLFDVINLPLSTAGQYTISLFNKNILLGSSIFEVIKAAPTAPQKAD